MCTHACPRRGYLRSSPSPRSLLRATARPSRHRRRRPCRPPTPRPCKAHCPLHHHNRGSQARAAWVTEGTRHGNHRPSTKPREWDTHTCNGRDRRGSGKGQKSKCARAYVHFMSRKAQDWSLSRCSSSRAWSRRVVNLHHTYTQASAQHRHPHTPGRQEVPKPSRGGHLWRGARSVSARGRGTCVHA